MTQENDILYISTPANHLSVDRYLYPEYRVRQYYTDDDDELRYREKILPDDNTVYKYLLELDHFKSHVSTSLNDKQYSSTNYWSNMNFISKCLGDL
jgi:hypothetical protein